MKATFDHLDDDVVLEVQPRDAVRKALADSGLNIAATPKFLK